MDKAAILEEIRQFCEQQAQGDILEDDITYGDLEETFGLKRDAARELARKLLASGNFIKLRVRGPNNTRVVVFRKVSPS